MATVLDVAAYILEKCGPMTAMKLQKLTYYSQAWHLVWAEDQLFGDEIQAWANGPVAPRLYGAHRGQFRVEREDVDGGDSENLMPRETETIDKVLDFYGDWTAQQLSDLTHREDPWVDARHGLPLGARSYSTITPQAMMEYYSSL